MRNTLAVPAVAAALLFVTGLAEAMSRPPAGENPWIEVEGQLTSPVVTTDGGTAYLQILLRSGGLPPGKRRPLNIAVVLDRSGSMSDQGKMEYAKEAVREIIRSLRRDDILSIVIYDDEVRVLRAAAPVRDKERILGLLEEVYPRNNTNLGGGMLEGFRQARLHSDREYTNRVILLSDGLANAGITDPRELMRRASRFREKGISLTTMGVGLEYNENLMVGLSESGGGNYYFIESPGSLAGIMRRELESVSAILAQDTRLRIRLHPGVSLVDVIGFTYERMADGVLIALGDVLGDDRREITIELRVPSGSGTRTVASGRCELGRPSVDGISGRLEFESRVRYTRDRAEVDVNRNTEAEAKAAVAVSTRAVEQAMQDLDKGDQAGAHMKIEEARAALMAAPASRADGPAGNEVRTQAESLVEHLNLLKDSTEDARRVKKEIQYRNYRTQKRK